MVSKPCDRVAEESSCCIVLIASPPFPLDSALPRRQNTNLIIHFYGLVMILFVASCCPMRR